MNKPIQFEINPDLLSSSEKDQLLALVRKGSVSKRVQPKLGSDYWFLTEAGYPSSTTWSGVAWDKDLYAFGNCFPTEEAAKFEQEKRKIELKLKDLARESVKRVCWDNLRELKYYIWYDHTDDELGIEEDTRFHAQGAIYFPTEEDCARAIEEVGEQRIKKYLFGEELR